MARLAGVPTEVIHEAQHKLLQLEEQECQAQTPAANPHSLQGDLFIDNPQAHPALAALRELEPDELSPKQALEAIYELKSSLKASER